MTVEFAVVDSLNPSAAAAVQDQQCMAGLCLVQALVWIANSLERKRPELQILEQRRLREGITEALQDGDYGFTDDAVAEFVLKVSRRGTGLDTSYSVLPKPSKVTKAETEAMAEVREMNVSSLTEGSHPFIKPAAEFSTDAADSEF